MLIPLTTGEQVVDKRSAVRKSGLPYGQDEVTRLEIVAEGWLPFIRPDRRRQMAIAPGGTPETSMVYMIQYPRNFMAW